MHIPPLLLLCFNKLILLGTLLEKHFVEILAELAHLVFVLLLIVFQSGTLASINFLNWLALIYVSQMHQLNFFEILMVLLLVFNDCVGNFLNLVVLLKHKIHFVEVIVISQEHMLVFDPW